MSKLISMTSYVLKHTKDLDFVSIFVAKLMMVRDYANFLKTPLELGQFVPCDKDGNVLEEPTYYAEWYNYGSFTKHGEKIVKECKKYQQAQDRVIFKGCSVEKRKVYYTIKNKGGDLIWVSWNHSKDIEYLIERNTTLTESKAKSLGL